MGDERPDAAIAPGEDTTVKSLMLAPPLPPDVKDTSAAPLPGTADTPVGAPGTVEGVAGADRAL